MKDLYDVFGKHTTQFDQLYATFLGCKHVEFLQNLTARKHRVYLSCYVNLYLCVGGYFKSKVEGRVNYQYIDKIQVFGGKTAKKKT